MTTEDRNVAEPVVLDTAVTPGPDGVVRSVTTDDLHANVVALGPGHEIGTHRNDAVDVVIVVVAGDVHVEVGGRHLDVGAGAALVVPKGTERTVRAGPAGARYITVHQRRGGLAIGPKPSA